MVKDNEKGKNLDRESGQVKPNVKRWAVIKYYIPFDPNRFAVIEYFHTKQECLDFIRKQKSDDNFIYGYGYYG